MALLSNGGKFVSAKYVCGITLQLKVLGNPVAVTRFDQEVIVIVIVKRRTICSNNVLLVSSEWVEQFCRRSQLESLPALGEVLWHFIFLYQQYSI